MENLKEFEVVGKIKVKELLESGSIIMRDYVFGGAKFKLYHRLKEKGYTDDDEIIIGWRHYFQRREVGGVYVHIVKAFDKDGNVIDFACDYD